MHLLPKKLFTNTGNVHRTWKEPLSDGHTIVPPVVNTFCYCSASAHMYHKFLLPLLPPNLLYTSFTYTRICTYIAWTLLHVQHIPPNATSLDNTRDWSFWIKNDVLKTSVYISLQALCTMAHRIQTKNKSQSYSPQCQYYYVESC